MLSCFCNDFVCLKIYDYHDIFWKIVGVKYLVRKIFLPSLSFNADDEFWFIEGYIINAYKYEEKISVQEGEWSIDRCFFQYFIYLGCQWKRTTIRKWDIDCGGCSTAFICPPVSLCEIITFQYEWSLGSVHHAKPAPWKFH